MFNVTSHKEIRMYVIKEASNKKDLFHIKVIYV